MWSGNAQSRSEWANCREENVNDVRCHSFDHTPSSSRYNEDGTFPRVEAFRVLQDCCLVIDWFYSPGLTRLKLDQLQMPHTYVTHSLLESRKQRTATVERGWTPSYQDRILLQRKVNKVKWVAGDTSVSSQCGLYIASFGSNEISPLPIAKIACRVWDFMNGNYFTGHWKLNLPKTFWSVYVYLYEEETFPKAQREVLFRILFSYLETARPWTGRGG